MYTIQAACICACFGVQRHNSQECDRLCRFVAEDAIRRGAAPGQNDLQLKEDLIGWRPLLFEATLCAEDVHFFCHGVSAGSEFVL